MIAPDARSGPNGNMWLFFLIVINDIGRPIKDPMNIVSNAFLYVKIIPIKNISFMSPPPIDSFLNIKSPVFFIIYIIVNDKIPFVMVGSTLFNPLKRHISISINIVKNISTLSGIIIYFRSLTVIIISIDMNVKTIIKYGVNPYTFSEIVKRRPVINSIIG